MMPRILEDPVARLLALHESNRHRTVVALAGYPGSGKTTVTKHWAKEVNTKLGGEELLILGTDGFHLTKAQLASMENPQEAFARRGAPWTFDPAAVAVKLRELKANAGKAAVGWPGFEHEIGDPAPDAVIVPPACRLVVVEGTFTLLREGPWADLDGYFDETWFLDTPLETSMARLYIRHQQAWGMTESEARERAESNDRLNCAYITPCRETADYIVC